MIEELHLINCQSHKNSLLKFHKGLNIIVGDTDSGKSAIIRGLEKIIYNNIPSKELISHWGGPLSLSMKVDGNKLILKNDGTDTYQLNKTLFKATGGKVPEEVSELLNMTDVNFQDQSTNWFLLNDTSGYVATYLNQIANISQIDSATKAIKSELNETKRTIEHDKKSLVEKEKVLESYSFLPLLQSSINEAEKIEGEIELIEVEIVTLSALLDQIEVIDTKLAKNKNILSLKPLIELSLSLKEQINKLELSLVKLEGFETSLLTLENNLAKLNQISKLKPLLTNIFDLQNKQSDLTTKLDSLDAYTYKLTTIDKKIKLAISNRESEHKLYHSELQKLDKCFFCGSKLKK